jgi:hypothetical protein
MGSYTSIGNAFIYLILFLVTALLPYVANAQDTDGNITKPSGDAAASVIDFFYNGQGQGVVLAQADLCGEIPTEGENKYECVGKVSPSALRSGTTYNLRMVFLVPRGDEVDNIQVKYIHDGEAIKTDQVDVSGSLRYRTWTAFTPRDTGEWTIRISQGGDLLQEMSLTVQGA